MTRKRVLIAKTALTVMLGAGLSGCDAFYRFAIPCYEQQIEKAGLSSQDGLKASEKLDGVWVVSQVDGVNFPATGYAPPGRTDGMKLLAGNLAFKTDGPFFSDDCNKLRTSRGTVEASFTTIKTGASAKEGRDGGRFYRDHDGNSTKLMADGRTQNVSVTPATGQPLTMEASFTLEGKVYKLTFTHRFENPFGF